MEENFLDINGLDKISLDEIYHPNQALVRRLTAVGAETYILTGTIYGCWITEDGNFSWFGHVMDGDKYKVVSSVRFEDLLDNCDPELLEPLLYHLDVFTKKKSKA